MTHTVSALLTYCSLPPSCHPSAVLIPSTERVFEWFGENNVYYATTAVGRHGLPGMLTPAALLTRLQNDPNDRPRRLVIFTDQLVSSRDATMEVRRDGKSLWISPLEFILNHQYHYRLYAANGGGLAYLPSQMPIQAVVKLVLGHLDAAKALDAQWLAREMQEERTQEVRRAQRRKYIRAMQSSLLAMKAAHGADSHPAADEKLGVLHALYAKG